jgi:hypothetical protein
MKVDPLIGRAVAEVLGVDYDYHTKSRMSTVLLRGKKERP